MRKRALDTSTYYVQGAAHELKALRVRRILDEPEQQDMGSFVNRSSQPRRGCDVGIPKGGPLSSQHSHQGCMKPGGGVNPSNQHEGGLGGETGNRLQGGVCGGNLSNYCCASHLCVY